MGRPGTIERMPRPIQAVIHPAALAHNLYRARHFAPHAKVWAVVKANAYGHGLARAFEGLRGADGFALLDLDEAQELRELGWRGPILLLEGCFEARDLELCSRLNLWHVVHRKEQIDWLASHKTTWPHHVFLKMNSGMNRLGFSPDAFQSAWLRLSGLTQVEHVVVMTHFANADRPGGMVESQTIFEHAVSHLQVERSLYNSAANVLGSSPADWVRAGIMLYGSSPDFPSHSSRHWQLQPAMTLRSKLVAIQDIQAGQSVGYGSTFVAPQGMRIGVVACGYADGYPRHAPNGTPVVVGGVRTKLVGRVSMDMITVDLSAVPGIDFETEVVLWGRAANGAVLPVDEVAQAAGTVGYELMCALSARVPIFSSSKE
jgi:alanine racemase